MFIAQVVVVIPFRVFQLSFNMVEVPLLVTLLLLPTQDIIHCSGGPRACLAGLSLGSRGFRSELKQGELGTSFYYNYSRCAVLHLSWSESLSSALKGEGAS